jgi:hypothetical protein
LGGTTLGLERLGLLLLDWDDQICEQHPLRSMVCFAASKADDDDDARDDDIDATSEVSVDALF